LRVILASIGILGFLLILSPLASPGGWGIKGDRTVKVERDRNWRVTKYSIEGIDGRTTWDWLGLIGVPITLLFLGILFQSQEQKRASQEAKEQRKLFEEENKEETLQRYFDRVAQLLIEKDLIGLPSGSDQHNPIVLSSSRVIRARTLSVLRSFRGDGDRKASVVLFLHETEILQKLNVSLRSANLIEAKLSCADLSGSNFSGAKLSGADLSGANFSSANLIEAKLSCADLSFANLRRANLREADLIRTNLSGADLFSAEFSMADLFEANLSRADLTMVKFGVVSLCAANLSDANLNGADLSAAKLMGANLNNIHWDEGAKWPDKEAFKYAMNIPPELKKQLDLE